MDWKQSLDRYLTTPPQDDYNDYCEVIVDKFSNDFYESNEEWTMGDECSNLMGRLFLKEYTPTESALIIERYFKIKNYANKIKQ